MFSRIRVVVLLLVPVLLIAASCKAKVYRTEEFGIELPIPKGVLSCPNPPGVHDHGPVLLLGSVRRNSCTNFSDNERIRYIEVFAEYNVFQDTLHLQDFLKRQCAGITKRPCGKPPDGLELPGLTSLAGRVDHPDGWTDILVVTEAGTPALDVDPTVPSMHYTIGLHTNKKHFQRDLAIFRKVLKTVRIHPK